MLDIAIPEPCHEKWNEMLPSEKGAFCSVCSKEVIDFTTLSDEEVKNYLLQRIGQQTCGRFKNHQLSSSELLLDKLLAGNIPFWKKFLVIVVILFSSFLTGCDQATQGKLDATQRNDSTVGVMLIDIKSDSEMKNPLTGELEISCTSTVGLLEAIIIPDTTAMEKDIMGDIVEVPIDTVVSKSLEKMSKDTIVKEAINKNGCDSLEVNKTIFYDL